MSRPSSPAYIPAVGDAVEVHEDATPRTGTITAIQHCGWVEVACRDSRRQVHASLCRLMFRPITPEEETR